MTITAQVIADSISPDGIRLTTMQLRYPRFIHAEFMTHRTFSRNASSSRAIPVAKMIEDIRRDPAKPVFWGSNKPGMQAGDELTFEDLRLAMHYWRAGLDQAINHAEAMVARGLHKQIANRILEPWAHINVVVTATDWANFFALRRHADAQPEIKVLADQMWIAMQLGTPTQLQPGEWHLPYFRPGDDLDYLMNFAANSGDDLSELSKKVSVARCARVSYLTHDGRQTTVEEDIALFDRLLGSQPLHASPAEHQATPLVCNGYFPGTDGTDVPVFQGEHLSGNFRGWKQFRKTLPGEVIPE